MKIRIATPAPPRSRSGNRVSALRWARILRGLGHRVTFGDGSAAGDEDLLVALHARKSHDAMRRFRALHPDRPIVLALTGTDLYRDLRTSARARRSLDLADRLVVLQGLAARALPAAARAKVRVIHQSVAPPRARVPRPRGAFRVAVVGHLRPVKDPLRAARAVRLLPPSSRVEVIHLGDALTPAMARAAEAEARRNPRYRWLGGRPRTATLRLVAASHLLVLSSRLEGGSNAVGEAVVAGTPVIASKIDGTVGLLGEDHPGYFEVGDTAGLAALLRRAETDPRFYRALAASGRRRRRLFEPARERAAWRALLAELAPPSGGARVSSPSLAAGAHSSRPRAGGSGGRRPSRRRSSSPRRRA